MAVSISKTSQKATAVDVVQRCRLHGESKSVLFDIVIKDGKISGISPHDSSQSPEATTHDAGGRLLLPSLCHAHIHLDKCFILQDEKFRDHAIQQGDFNEAMKITGEAKAQFTEDDVYKRGSRLIRESVAAGVTDMRVYVEVDEIVGQKSLKAALRLKHDFHDLCRLQICAFAQLALFAEGQTGEIRRSELVEALRSPEVEVVGSTPYVESERGLSERNVRWTIDQALQHEKHIDFHLDYNLDSKTEPLVGYVLHQLGQSSWRQNQSVDGPRTISLGHCTRLSLFTNEQWSSLANHFINGHLPVSFVGLPTSDLYMMGRPPSASAADRPRGTLQVPHLVRQHDLNCAIAVNNVGNAFTPHGSCDPLQLASLGMLVYQAATIDDCTFLYEAVSTRARATIGIPASHLRLQVGDAADFILFGDGVQDRPIAAAGVVYDTEPNRTVFRGGRMVAVCQSSAQLFS